MLVGHVGIVVRVATPELSDHKMAAGLRITCVEKREGRGGRALCCYEGRRGLDVGEALTARKLFSNAKRTLVSMLVRFLRRRPGSPSKPMLGLLSWLGLGSVESTDIVSVTRGEGRETLGDCLHNAQTPNQKSHLCRMAWNTLAVLT